MAVDQVLLQRQFIARTIAYDKCHCSLISSLVQFFEYHEPNTWSELVSLVANSNISALKNHVREDFAICDRHRNTPLHLSVILKKYDVFDYLMTVEGLDVNIKNRKCQTSLYLAVMNNDEYFVTELIKKGGDVNLIDLFGCTPLHAAATRFYPKICKILLENGADLDWHNFSGKTGLYHACEYGTLDSIYMLLYYGASARISDEYGILPLTVAMRRCVYHETSNMHLECHEVLFNHTFHEKQKMVVNLSTLTVAMRINSPLFPDILEKVHDVRYSRNYLTELAQSAFMINLDYFELFAKKFSYIVEKILEDPDDLHLGLRRWIVLSENVDDSLVKLMNFITLLIRLHPTLNFIKNSMEFTYFITVLIRLLKMKKISYDIFEQTTYFLYSHGLPCELSHIVLIYENFGFCKIFKLMLELDVIVTYKRPKAVMPYLIYDINLTIEKFVDLVAHPSKKYVEALKFFANKKIRNFLAPLLKKTLKKTPPMPSLVELSRDAARLYIIEAFEVKTTRDFYRVIKKLPINEVYKKIITYEKELYRLV